MTWSAHLLSMSLNADDARSGEPSVMAASFEWAASQSPEAQARWAAARVSSSGEGADALMVVTGPAGACGRV